MKEGLADAAEKAGLPLHAAIYDRVSKDTTGRQRSVEEQEEANRNAAEALGWVITSEGVFTDNDRSASRFAKKSRPGWADCRAAILAGRYPCLILWEVSRGDRDDLGWIEFLHSCRELGVLIHITSHGHTYDPRKRRDYKTLAEEGLDSADESEKISVRIRRNVESYALKGHPHGYAPFGYARDYEVDRHGRRRLVRQYPDYALRTVTGMDGATVTYSQAGVVEEIARRLLAGETCKALAAEFNWRGIPTSRNTDRGWADDTVRKIALNPTYAGRRVYQGKSFSDATWDSIISLSDHQTLVAHFSDTSRRTQRDASIKHLGSGLYRCAVCGVKVRTVKKGYGRAYVCVPPRFVRDPSWEPPRKATDAEIKELAGLERREQTRRALELYEQGVTQNSMADGLGINRKTFSLRIRVERAKRDEVNPQAAPEPKPRRTGAYHVTRPVHLVDAFVEKAMLLRLSRPDVLELLTEDTEADQRVRELTAEVTEKQGRLDEARDAYAAGKLPLEALLRIESRLEPEIQQARARMNRTRVGPVLDGLLLPSLPAVQEEWARRSLPQRREAIRALVERVEILPIGGGRKVVPIERSVRIVWRDPGKPKDGSVAAVDAP